MSKGDEIKDRPSHFKPKSVAVVMLRSFLHQLEGDLATAVMSSSAMPRNRLWSWKQLIYVSLFLASAVITERFREGHKYDYKYEVEIGTGEGVAFGANAGIQVLCHVHIIVHSRCELVLKVSDCTLEDHKPKKGSILNANSETLAKELSRYPTYLQYSNGEILDHKIAVDNLEPQHVINIKRGIVSTLQLPVGGKDSKSKIQYDIFGSCLTHFSEPATSNVEIETYRDLVTCNLTHSYLYQSQYYSFIKTLVGGYTFAPITEMKYPYQSDVRCHYSVGSSSLIKSVECLQQQAYLSSSPAINVSQRMLLLSESPLVSQPSDISLKNKQWVDLAMTFAAQDVAEHTAQDVMAELEETMIDFLGQGNKNISSTDVAAVSFKQMVDVLRKATATELKFVKKAVFSCHDSSACHQHLSHILDPVNLQAVQEKLFFNGLMSCGTDSCMVTLTECMRDNFFPDSEIRSVIFNMGLFYQPSVEVARLLSDHCQAKNLPRCWLSLSAMISRLSQSTNDREEFSNLITNIASHLHNMIGERCEQQELDSGKPSDISRAEEALTTAIKAFSNMGKIVSSVYTGKSNSGQSLTQTLLQCLKSNHVNLIVARSAGQALSALGLPPSIASELLTFVRDEDRPVVLRAALFDVLLFHGDVAILQSLLRLLDTARLENMQTYIVTRISSVVEDMDPQHQRLRLKLRELLQERILPQLGDNILSKSHYTQFSRHFTIPLTSLHIGGSIDLNLIYIPSSNVFHSLTLKAGHVVDNDITHLFEFTIDLEDWDTLLELLMRKGQTQQNNEDVQMGPLEMLDLLQKFIQKSTQAEAPTFTHYSEKVKLALREIFHLANMKKAAFPHAFVSYKFLGYEMGSFSSDALLLKMKQFRMRGDLIKQLMHILSQGVERMLLRAFKLFDIHKTLPTVAGLPLTLHVDTSVVTKALAKLKTDATEYVRNQEHISTDTVFQPSISASFQTEMQVSVGDYSSVGIGVQTVGIGQGSWMGVVKYMPPQTPGGVEHDLLVNRKLGQEPFQFLDIKSKVYLLPNEQDSEMWLSKTKKNIVKCLPPVYTQLLGHHVCLSGMFYKSTLLGPDLPIPLAGPFIYEASLTPADSNLDHIFIHLKFQRKIGEESQPHGISVDFTFEGPGTDLSRQVMVSIDKDNSADAFKFNCTVRDAGIEYKLERMNFCNETHYHYRYASVLTRHGKALNTVILENEGDHVPSVASLPSHEKMHFDKTEKNIHLNISFGSLSFDYSYRNYLPVPTYKVLDVTLIYYCEPHLKLFYALHPNPRLSATQGHKSTFSYHQETKDSKTSFAETWKGFYKVVVLLPGQNITQITDMVADLTGAYRLTDIFWTYGDKMDLIHMDSIVQNRSTSELFSFDYTLYVISKGKFEFDIDGHVHGPRPRPLAMLDINMDVNFTSKRGLTRRSKRSLNSVLQDLGNVKLMIKEKAVSMYEAAKTRLMSFWGGDQQEQRAETLKESFTAEKLMTEAAEIGGKERQPFWKLPEWSIGIDGHVQMVPHMIGVSSEMQKMVGVELKWVLNSSLPRGVDELLRCNGSIYKGRTKWMKLELVDAMHHLKFNWQAEHYHTPMVVHHHHNWTLVETHSHSFDRSFNFRIDFEHYQHLEYDLILKSPQTNLTHHINYTKISPMDHTIRAYAYLHSVRPFDLVYFESTDVHGPDLVTHTNLTSTVLDHQFELRRETGPSGVKFTGHLHLDGRLPILMGERNLTVSLTAGKNAPPQCQLTYLYADGSGTQINIAMLGPKEINIGIIVVPPNVLPADIPENDLTWSMKLVEPRLMQHTVQFSSTMLYKIEALIGTVQKLSAHKLEQMGKIVSQNVRLDLKDRIIPFLDQSLDKYFKNNLYQVMATDPDSKKVKLYKLAVGATDAVNRLWLETPAVQMMRQSHLDEAVACLAEKLTEILSNWILHPPFFVHHYAKTSVNPTIQQIWKTSTVTFSTPLLLVMSAFNQMPQATVIEKEMMALLKRKVSGVNTIKKDIAIILDGQRVKTFDGRAFDISDFPPSVCTYLLGADFKHGQFALTYNRDGVTAVTTGFGLTLGQDGSVIAIGNDSINYLPFTSPGGQLTLTLHHGELHLSLANGQADVAFSPDSDFYLIEADRNLNNASLGLLGTNNMEKGDDFLLADGTLAEDSEELQSYYELTGNPKCTRLLPSSPVSCNKFDFQSCMSLSDQWMPILPCLMMVNPGPFILQCQIAECEGRSGCGAVNAYLAACHHRGIDIGTPPACGACQEKSGLDLVIVQSLFHLITRDEDPLASGRLLVSRMADFDLNAGVVTYGGMGQWEEPRSHLLKGKLFQKCKRAKKHMYVAVDPGKEGKNADTAILTAADFPFRSHATKVVVLIHPYEPRVEQSDKSYLLEILKARGITLVLASTYSEFTSNAVLGLSSGGHVIGNGGKLPPPEDIYSQLVMSTGGLWLNLDILNSGPPRKIKQVANEVSKLKTLTQGDCLP